MNLKKISKKTCLIISLVFIFSSMFTSIVFAATDTIKSSPSLATHVYKGYNKGKPGPISIVPVTLYQNGNRKQAAYLVSLSGTELVWNQSTGLLTDLKSGFELDSPYLLSVIKTINANIPKNSNLILAGHSLGGMIAEQASGNDKVKSYYNILNVVTFGSPLVNPFGREGTIKRLGDKADVVPYLSASGVYLPLWQVIGLNKEDGGYSNPGQAHVESYTRTDIWGSYDVLGFKNGKSYLTYDTNQLKFYPAPTK